VLGSSMVGSTKSPRSSQCSKINAAGQWIERTGRVSLTDLFEKLSTQEFNSCATSEKGAEEVRSQNAATCE